MTLRDCIQGSESLSHQEYYRKIVDALGREQVEALIPFSKKEIETALEHHDIHLNTLKLAIWDTCHNKLYPLVKELMRACAKDQGKSYVTICFSISEAVCIMKSAARDKYSRNHS